MPPAILSTARLLAFGVLFCLQLLVTQAATSVTLGWDQSPEADVAGYKIYYGLSSRAYASLQNAGAATSMTVTGLLPGRTYYFAVTAYSAAGVESSMSEEVSFRLSNEAPEVILTSPLDGANLNTGAVQLTASASDPDDSISRVEFYVGGDFVGEDAISPYAADWQAMDAGEYEVYAVAYDAGGSATRSAPSVVQIRRFAISSLARKRDGSCEITITGASGVPNTIWVSDDLQRWTPLETVANPAGQYVIVDPGAVGATRRFYRVTAE